MRAPMIGKAKQKPLELSTYKESKPKPTFHPRGTRVIVAPLRMKGAGWLLYDIPFNIPILPIQEETNLGE